MLKKLFSHSLIYGLSPHIPRVASILTLPIITAHLTESDYGVFGLITAIVEGLTIFSTLGMNVVLSNTFYRSPGQFKWAWRQIYGFLILWNFLYALIVCLVLWAIIPEEAAEHTWLIIALNMIPVIFFGPTAIIGRIFYQLLQKPLQIAIRSVIVGFVAVGLNVYLIAYVQLGYLGWFISICVSQMILQISYFVPIRYTERITPIFNFKWRFIKSKLRVTLPTIPHYYGGYLLNSSDRVLMKILGSSIGDIGLYNAANTVSNLVQKAGTAAGQAVGPLLSQSYRQNKDRQARYLVFTLQIMFLIGTFLLSVWMKEIFYFLIKNDSLRDVYPLSIILIMAYNYRPMYFGAIQKLFYLEKTVVLPKITLTAGIGSVVLNLIFIPIFGFQAAAYVTFAALMYMGFSGYFLKDFKSNIQHNYHPLFWFVVIIVLTVIGYYAVYLEIILKAIISVLVLGVGGISLLVLSKKEGSSQQ